MSNSHARRNFPAPAVPAVTSSGSGRSGGIDATARLTQLLAQSPLSWGQTLFPHHFRSATPAFHLKMLTAATNFDRVAIASPRRSAKSTLLLFLFPFHRIMFRQSRFIVIVSNTFKKAAMHLDSIKKELQDNQMLQKVHPPVKLTRDAEGDTVFRQPDGFETWVLCKGVDQLGSLRGVKFGAYRPDVILGDDMEDDELVRNADRRNQLKEDFDSVLTPIGGSEATKHIYVGTILHDDCQLAKLVDRSQYREYVKLVFKAHLDPDGPAEASLWPENWTLDYLRELRRDKPNVYAKEMQNDPVAGANTRFKREDFRYWRQEASKVILTTDDGPISYDIRECRAAIACDLAWKEKRDSDASVLLPGLLTPGSEILVSDYVSQKGMRPDQVAEQLFLIVDRLERLTGDVVPVGFEKAMLENVTQWLLRREMQKRNKWLLTRELVWDADKNTRIETRLQPRYAQHAVFHKQGMGDLEHQLERFPFGTHDDLIDALQGLVQLLQHPKQGTAIEVDDKFMRLRAHTIEHARGLRSPARRDGRSKFPWQIYRLPV